MSGRIQALIGLGVISRASSFLQKKDYFSPKQFNGIIDNRKITLELVSIDYLESDSVAPISDSSLESLFNQTIYNTDGTFYLIDYLLEAGMSVSRNLLQWMRQKFSLDSETIENRFKVIVETKKLDDEMELKLLNEWLSKQESGRRVDSDLLALRMIETLILLAIVAAEFYSSEFEDFKFKILEEKLIDWSEAVGLIRSLSDDRLSSAADLSMDIDFDPSVDVSQLSTILNVKESEFEIYLLKKFKHFSIIHEAVEIVADRCGIPIDSDFEESNTQKKPTKSAFKEQVKHWRRVKPITLPVKRINSSVVKKSSSLSVSDMKSNRFFASSSSSRQIDLALKPSIQANLSLKNRRRHSESSASAHIIQHTTPTKNTNPKSRPAQTSEISDSVVILETPPKALASKQVHLNDLSGSVRRLFPMEE